MAIQRFKVSLNNAVFPLVSSAAPRAVFVPTLDSAPRQNRGFVGSESTIDFNLAQVLGGENFMPVAAGVRSVGYEQVVAPTVNTDFDSIISLRDEAEGTMLYSPAADKNYIYDPDLATWSTRTVQSVWTADTLSGDSIPANSTVTAAFVDGKMFVCYSGLKSDAGTPVDMSIMQWDATIKEFLPTKTTIINVPFAAGTIAGISASNGYLLLYSGLEIAWASFNGTAFDFSPYSSGAVTGSGSQIPEDLKSTITAVAAVPGGFIMFSDKNAVAANYHSQSISSPWVFREVPNAGGLSSYEQVTVNATLGEVYAYTTAGLQKVSINSAETIYPEISDFIAGRRLERYDYATHQLERGGTTIDFYTKITAVTHRYIVLSYGFYPGIFSYALVIDTILKRIGKLRVVHRDAFYYKQPRGSGALTYSMLMDIAYEDTAYDYTGVDIASQTASTAQHSMAFLLPTGEVKVAVWSDEARDVEDTAAVVIGRIQLTRTSNTQLNRVEADGMISGNMYINPSANGSTLSTSVDLVDVERVDNYLCQGGLVDCKNFNIAVEGTFHLSSLIVEATTAGKF